MPSLSSASHVLDVLGDPERLRVLAATGLMDSPREEHLDRWTQVAAEALHAPVALLSLVDARRQFFKSSFGLTGPAAVERGAPLSHSFCQHVVASGRHVAIDDAREDDALSGNAMVRERGIVAYAGAPIVVAGQTLGALCVTQTAPRTWAASELRLLNKLAKGVAYELQLRVTAAELADSARLVEAHNRIHRLIAEDEPLVPILGAIVASVEDHDEELQASITTLDGGLVAGVSTGPSWGPWDEELLSDDIGRDARWDDARDGVDALWMRHCWTFPIMSRTGSVLGRFSAYGSRPRSPTGASLRELRDAARLAGIAIDWRRSRDQLVFAAAHDALTGLANRSTALDHLDEILARDPETRGPVALVVVDLDRLRTINDTLGHEAGDHVIRQAAGRLSDCAAPGDLVARLGGEEFVVVSGGDHDQAVALADRIVATLRMPLTGLPPGHDVAVTGSAGIAMVGPRDRDARGAVARADAAMAVAKSRGGNQHATSACSDHAAPRRLLIENALRHALEREELSLVFQPLQRFGDRRTFAVEALVRWTHAELGVVGPAEFIPIAEQTGQIGEIGGWIADAACAALTPLSAEYGVELQLCLNVSAQQLRDPDLPARLAGAAAAQGVAVERLFVEITETALLACDEVTMQNVRALDAMGFRIALDDFGTGYSSLAVLKGYPIKAIKIDRSFVVGLPDDRDSLAIVTALMAMARSLGLSVVAEGIETERQYEALRGMGCDYAQGYLLGRPAPVGRAGDQDDAGDHVAERDNA